MQGRPAIPVFVAGRDVRGGGTKDVWGCGRPSEAPMDAPGPRRNERAFGDKPVCPARCASGPGCRKTSAGRGGVDICQLPDSRRSPGRLRASGKRQGGCLARYQAAGQAALLEWKERCAITALFRVRSQSLSTATRRLICISTPATCSHFSRAPQYTTACPQECASNMMASAFSRLYPVAFWICSTTWSIVW